MYNLWIIVIVLAIIEVVLLVLNLMAKSLNWFAFDDMGTEIVLFLGVIALVVVICMALVSPLIATTEVNALLAERDTLQNLFENREDLDKIYITQRVVEYNKEVARIIASANSCGNWSAYAFTNYELLTFIEI